MGEEAVKVAGFDRVSVWRPGLLGRGDKARLVERIAGYISPKASRRSIWHQRDSVLRAALLFCVAIFS
ncbi:unnamed protein product [Phaeothamnion confervicola]